MRRALLIGSQTGGLTGVDADVELMDQALRRMGFSTVLSTGKSAGADEIRSRYHGLIQDTGSADTAVVYYSGHGGRERNTLKGADPQLPEWFQFIVPTDFDDRSDGRLRCLLAEELSLLQRQLTDRSRNVTVILDCCHSARMSRNGGALPKANEQLAFPAADLIARWQAVADDQSDAAAQGDANPLAVRLVGCSPDQSAYELPVPSLGGSHGALTANLYQVLSSPTAAAMTWRDALDIVRRQIMDVLPQQRPEVEGPVDRLLFSLDSRSASGVLRLRVESGAILVDDAAIFGVGVGDTYAMVGPGGNPAAPLGTAVVRRIVGGRAVLEPVGLTSADVPPGSSAWPLDVALGTRLVAVVPTDNPGRAALVGVLDQSPFVRVTAQTTSSDAAVLATVRLHGDAVQVLDADRQPLYRRPLGIADAAAVRDAVGTLARATHVRDLESGTGAAVLPAAGTVTFARLTPDGGERPLTENDHLFAADRVVVRLVNGSSSTLYFSVLDVGVTGNVSVLTSSEPDGVTVGPGDSYALGLSGPGPDGIEMYWPEGVPDEAPRTETFVVIVADRKIDGLTRLEQGGVVPRSAGPRSSLERLVDSVAAGRRDARPVPMTASVRYRVERLDVVFHPVTRPADGGEPTFELDTRPDPSFRLVVPRGGTTPGRVAVRLKELVVHSNRSFLRARVRVDALVVTSVAGDVGQPYQSGTAHFDRVRDGDRLPFDDLLIYEGPAARFLDIAVWVTRADDNDVSLAELMATELSGTEVTAAVTTLAALAVAAPAAAVVAGTVGAIAVLVRTAARVIDRARGTSIGVYRTSLLPYQRFGVDPPPARAGRHPDQGLIAAQDMSFAFEVVDTAED